MFAFDVQPAGAMRLQYLYVFAASGVHRRIAFSGSRRKMYGEPRSVPLGSRKERQMGNIGSKITSFERRLSLGSKLKGMKR